MGIVLPLSYTKVAGVRNVLCKRWTILAGPGPLQYEEEQGGALGIVKDRLGLGYEMLYRTK